jgi:protoheme IX farnesyltransferase
VKLFRRLAAVTTASVFALVGVGGLVRATDSGLGCPGWPKCFGYWFPPFGRHGEALRHALIESSHRYVTFIVSVEVIALLVLAIGNPQVRRRAGATLGAAASAILLMLQAGLGAAVVNSELNALLVTVHYANAMLLVAAVVFTTIAAFVDLRDYRPTARHRAFARNSLILTVATFAVILLGTYVRARQAGLVFSDWPLMNGSLIPRLSLPLAGVQFAHRVAVLLVFVGLVAVVVQAIRREADRPSVRGFALLASGLYLGQALIGAGFVLSGASTPFVAGHELVGSLVWGSTVALLLLAYRKAPTGEPEALRRAVEARRNAVLASGFGPGTTPSTTAENGAPAQYGASAEGEAVERAEPTRWSRMQGYAALTKPHIIVLLLITTVPAMVLADDGWPSPWLIIATLFGGTLAAAGANVINCYIDRDIDEVMRRTRRRPLPKHEVSPAVSLWFGIGLGLVSFVFLSLTVNVLSAVLATSALLFYVFVYTLWMKRTTPQNIVIGGAAGAAPVLVGWAAVTGRVGLPAIVMFLIVFYWTPPHFWALSMRYESDYRAAGVPMLPVVRGMAETTRQILLYSFVLFAITLLLYPVARLGLVYLTAALVLGLIFLYEALVLRRERTVGRAVHLFNYSNTYLALLFAAVAVDPLVRTIR